tara:strand:+ start:470 stop:955 length:486 start_codon:yes stop_codon:yes gene_type:complete
MSEIKYKVPLNLILLFSFFALLSAYYIQFVLGYQPCNLCLIERIPYISVIIIIFLCFFFKKFERISLIAISLIFFLASLISFYHFGIEQGFIKESFACDLSIENNILTKEAILSQLKEGNISCKDVIFKIFGLSLATINIFISSVLTFITMKIFLNYEKNK